MRLQILCKADDLDTYLSVAVAVPNQKVEPMTHVCHTYKVRPATTDLDWYRIMRCERAADIHS